MAVMKQINIVAEEISADILNEIYKQCDWQIGQFLPEACEGNEYNEAHSYLVELVVGHLSKKVNNG